jgi:pimeloyl-ACP methyl ester carboxylesterase
VNLFFRIAVLFSFFLSGLRAENGLHRHIVVFVPAYEGSQLVDPNLSGAPCVWGSADAIRRQELYWAIRLPNALTARPMLRAGPLDVYGSFVSALTQPNARWPKFSPYTDGKDFRYFSYDWRQEIATESAPALGRALESYAKEMAEWTHQPEAQIKFVIVAHSMGGLVARTLLSQQPRLADRVERLYLVGTPNLGSVKAVKTLLVGPGGLRENPVSGLLGWLAGLLPNDVKTSTTKLVAITRPSLWELLPFEDPGWEMEDDLGRSSRVAAADILKVSTWQRYWPSAELERQEYLEPWRDRFMGGAGEPAEGKNWEFCQDTEMGQLQRILAAVREWRLSLGKLSYTDQLLTRPGGASRLRLAVGTGLQTPTGVISSGRGDDTKVRYLFGADGDGDGTVLAASVEEDLKNPAQIVRLPKATHGQLLTAPEFLNQLQRDLTEMDPEPLFRGPEPIIRGDESTVP